MFNKQMLAEVFEKKEPKQKTKEISAERCINDSISHNNIYV